MSVISRPGSAALGFSLRNGICTGSGEYLSVVARLNFLLRCDYYGDMTRLLNILRGMEDAFTLLPERRGYHVGKDGPHQDFAATRGDFERVGRELREVLSRDQQANHGSSKR